MNCPFAVADCVHDVGEYYSLNRRTRSIASKGCSYGKSRMRASVDGEVRFGMRYRPFRNASIELAESLFLAGSCRPLDYRECRQAHSASCHSSRPTARELTPLARPRGFQTADLCPQAKIWQALTDSPRTAPNSAACRGRFKPAPGDVADCCRFLAGCPTKRNDIQAKRVDDAIPSRRRRLELRGHDALRRQGPGLFLRQLRACGSKRARRRCRSPRFSA